MAHLWVLSPKSAVAISEFENSRGSCRRGANVVVRIRLRRVAHILDKLRAADCLTRATSDVKCWQYAREVLKSC
jgi:hypothetical protein